MTHFQGDLRGCMKLFETDIANHKSTCLCQSLRVHTWLNGLTIVQHCKTLCSYRNMPILYSTTHTCLWHESCHANYIHCISLCNVQCVALSPECKSSRLGHLGHYAAELHLGSEVMRSHIFRELSHLAPHYSACSINNSVNLSGCSLV